MPINLNLIEIAFRERVWQRSSYTWSILDHSPQQPGWILAIAGKVCKVTLSFGPSIAIGSRSLKGEPSQGCSMGWNELRIEYCSSLTGSKYFEQRVLTRRTETDEK